ncbi:hypothetical protein [Pseudoalteromonas phage PH357]|nr:hypothetical protein [Pseudoalteromonas phage PH357]
MNKITDAKTYSEFEVYCLSKGYTLSELSSKKSYFTNKDSVKYSNIIYWIDMFREKHTVKKKITSELAKSYMDKYGASEAVRQLKYKEGISITRQGLYKAAKDD